MAEKQEQAFTYAIHKLDKDGKRAGLVSEDAKLVSAPSKEDAKIKILTRLAVEKQYDPDNPNVEVVLVPFGAATA